ncbi:FMN-binding protein [Streptomyces antnestii]|uniref:FMN-binding protein n=1 Tax=Streptomyces antnestii TaxID=2494256 RepID=A0A437PSX6_9ACTN|nr:FMN-binding protein [Streptomyces sp. San01]RVU25330.1 FMN-binding protein [Streptomyces sp. San01]
MRAHPIRRTVLTCVATVSVTTLALALKPHSQPVSAAPTVTRPPAASGGTGSGSGSGNGSGGASGSASGSASGKRTLTGETVQTRYGPVQVEITIVGSKITAARAVRTPSGDRRSQDIASSSVPTLVQETLDAQSARIDTVSGATFTSEGYMTSLQSALDQARG